MRLLIYSNNHGNGAIWSFHLFNNNEVKDWFLLLWTTYVTINDVVYQNLKTKVQIKYEGDKWESLINAWLNAYELIIGELYDLDFLQTT